MSSKSSGTFGAPKPLPGQAGYGAKETDILKKDASEMESRLLALQEKMRQQQEESEKSSKTGGGTKWKSSRTEKGSVTSYGREVREKHKKRMEAQDPSLKMTSSTKRAQGATQLQQPIGATAFPPQHSPKVQSQSTLMGDFTTKEVEAWTIADVGAWLTAVQLPQYASAFADNEINGSILLDVTLDDLDYMKISILGHRKVLLKGVEDLRKNKRYTGVVPHQSPQKCPAAGSAATAKALQIAQHQQQQPPPPIPSPAAAGGEAKTATAAAAAAANVKTTHWSHLEPLSSNPVRGGSGGAGMVNAADGDSSSSSSDVLDEAAERAAFQEAVAEWRRQDQVAAAVATAEGGGGGGRGIRIVREYLGGSAATPAAATAGHSASLAAAAAGGGDAGMWNNPFAPSVSTAGGGGGEVLDEAAERRAFQAAVAEWRGGRSVSGAAATHSSAPSAAAAVSVTTSTTTTTTTTTATASANTARKMHLGGGGKVPVNDSDIDDDEVENDPATSNSPAVAAVGEGMLDEEKEHQEFVKAVNAWRNRGQGNSGAESSSSSSSGGAAAGMGVSVAQQLARELEKDREMSAMRLKQQKEDAQNRLREANLELERLRLNRPAPTGSDLTSATPSAIVTAGDDNESKKDAEISTGYDKTTNSAAYTYHAPPKERSSSSGVTSTISNNSNCVHSSSVRISSVVEGEAVPQLVVTAEPPDDSPSSPHLVPVAAAAPTASTTGTRSRPGTSGSGSGRVRGNANSGGPSSIRLVDVDDDVGGVIGDATTAVVAAAQQGGSNVAISLVESTLGCSPNSKQYAKNSTKHTTGSSSGDGDEEEDYYVVEVDSDNE